MRKNTVFLLSFVFILVWASSATAIDRRYHAEVSEEALNIDGESIRLNQEGALNQNVGSQQPIIVVQSCGDLADNGCDTQNDGMVRYRGGIHQYCNGAAGAWESFLYDSSGGHPLLSTPGKWLRVPDGTGILPFSDNHSNLGANGWRFTTIWGVNYYGTRYDGSRFVATSRVDSPAFYYSSDRRLKKNIHVIDNALDKILSIRGIDFEWKKSGKKQVGFIAQEVEKTFPELVGEDEITGMKSIQYGNLVAPVVESIRELNDKVEDLASQNRYLIDENKRNNNEIELLKEKIINVEKCQKQADFYLFLLSVMLFIFIVFVCRKNNK